ncbi:MAG: hypothetical protein BA861_11100 [Desulfobacterales bacterium S3730MH5]|nr:MAG: hypothetical protein BA861_11100 [Desulfobacterales bacterium S3730MH5]
MDTPQPGLQQIANLVEGKNHILNSIAPPGPEEWDHVVNRVFVASDRSAFLFIRFNRDESTVCDDVVTLTSARHTEGSFVYRSFNMNLGQNMLGSLSMEADEPKEIPESAVNTNDALKGMFAGANGKIGNSLTSTVKTMDQATGVVTFNNMSNVPDLIDLESSGLVVDASNTSAFFQVAFKENVTAPKDGVMLGFWYASLEILFGSAYFDGKKIYKSDTIDLTDDLIKSETLKAQIWPSVAGPSVFGESMYVIEDVVDITRYQDSIPMIAMKQMKDTRADPDGDMYNNFPNSNDTRQPIVSGNTATHYIVDLDRLFGKGIVSAWDESDYGKSPKGDGSDRIPLLMIHGWQGAAGLTNACNLSGWKNSPVFYYYNFIDFYLTSKSLQDRYHVYFMRWPSYKHLSFNAQMLKDMLVDIRANKPDTDMAEGLSDPSTGVVLITHSTGGLIARSAIEMYDAFSDNPGDQAYLRHAVILASPNHGSPYCIPVPGISEIVGSLFANVLTQGAADLSWDSFDDNSIAKLLLGIFPVYYDHDRNRRWDPKKRNTKAFDQHFINLLDNPNMKTYNPWLAWLNQSLYSSLNGSNQDLKDKYTLYSGWLRFPYTTPDPQTFPYNLLKNGGTDNTGGDYLSKAGFWDACPKSQCGYMSDCALCVSANLFATDGGNPAFNPTNFDDIPEQTWYPHSKFYYTGDQKFILIIGHQEDHPLGMAFRVLWDYDHGNLFSGAIKYQGSEGKFDEFMNMDKAISQDTKLPTIFIDETTRQDYIKAALDFSGGAYPETSESEVPNPLFYEPTFLVIEKDLLDIAG